MHSSAKKSFFNILIVQPGPWDDDMAAQWPLLGLLCSPLHAAALHCDTAVLTALLDANADVHAKAEAEDSQRNRETISQPKMGVLHVLVWAPKISYIVSYTPRKINMEPKNHKFVKENHLPNQIYMGLWW